MVGTDVAVRADGSVVGTFHYVKGFKKFNEAVPSEQEGNYFPFRLTQRSLDGKMTLKVNGVAKPEKTGINYDPEIIFRIPDKSATFTVELDGTDYVTFNFRGATLEAQG